MIKVKDPKWQKLISVVNDHKQEHILRYWDRLDSVRQQKFMAQIDQIDFELLDQLIAQVQGESEQESVQHKLEPAEFITLEQRKEQDKKVLAAGESTLKSGKVAAFLVAGGQGTRLGFDGPKGQYPVTPVRGKSLFQLHAEKLRAVNQQYGKIVPWYIMTSQTNHQATVSFFRKNNHFGYNPADVAFFAQDMVPAIDHQGKLILDAPDHIFRNPNGHGGSLQALWKSGTIADMKKRGIEHIFYFQVDNVLTRICDPVYIGYHVTAGSEMSNKVVRKKYPEEKMGVLCRIEGRLGLVEYSDLDEENMYAKDAEGNLKFWAGNIATHLFQVTFVERENRDGFRLPYHIAEKSIPYLDDSGKLITPQEKNGIKFECFVFDALQDVNKSISIEIERHKEFSPLKNKEGENSPQTVQQDLNNTYGRWLEEAGFEIKRDQAGKPVQNIEISPLFALGVKEVMAKKEQIKISSGDIYIE